MLFYPNEKIALFVDGANLYGMLKGLGFDIDYKKLRLVFADKGHLVRAFYYTALDDSEEFMPVRPLVDYLEYNGWKVVTKLAREYTNSQGQRRVKRSMDMELAMDAVAMADHVDHFIIFSGDGHLCALVDALQRRGRRVTVVATVKAAANMCSDDLRRVADDFAELHEMRNATERPRSVPHA